MLPGPRASQGQPWVGQALVFPVVIFPPCRCGLLGQLWADRKFRSRSGGHRYGE